MPLIEAKPNYRLLQTVLPATPSNAIPSLRITASGSINTKGSWTQIVASTNYDVEFIYHVSSNMTANGVTTGGLLDIGTGAAASETVIVENIFVGGCGLVGVSPQPLVIPIRIPAGTRVAARLQSNTASRNNESFWAFMGGSNVPTYPLYTGVETIAANTATSGGTAHTAGNTGTESSWTNIGSAITQNWRAVQLHVGTPSGTVSNSLAYHFEIGYSSTKLHEYLVGTGGNENSTIFPYIPLPCNIPAGTQMQIRGECSGTAQALEFTLMGYY